VSLDQLKVMSAIERCRMVALGGHVARCENAACGHTLIAYNSCRNRHCPKCQAAASRRWLADREAELLPVPYFHVVNTLPSKLRDIAYQNKRVIYDLLMKAAAETTLTIAADPKRLGARIGITAVLHSWGSTLTHHPHVHMIVPGGGLSFDGTRWLSSRSDFFVHVKLLARLFRGKMLAMLTHAHDAGHLKFFNTHAGLADKSTFSASSAGCGASGGWSTARRRSRDPSRGCAIYPVTRIVSPSRTAVSLQPTTPVSRSAGRTTASTARTAERRCGFPLMSSSGASCYMCCQRASTASATTGSLPEPTAPRASHRSAHCSRSYRPQSTSKSSRTSRPMRHVCCLAPVRAVAAA
jgi:hypothetical protein